MTSTPVAPPTAPTPGPPVTPDEPGPPAAPRSRGPLGTVMVWGGGVVAVVLIATGAVQATGWFAVQRETRTETFAAADRLVVRGSGDVEVVVDPAATATSVQVSDRWGLNRPTFESTEGTDGTLELRSTCPDTSVLWIADGVCASDLVVTVTPDTVVDLSTTSGHVTAGDLTGDVAAHSDYGDVRVRATGGAVHATTSSGHVTVSDAGGAVLARSSYGDVEVTAAVGAVQAGTDSGHVRVTDVDGDVVATSQYGDVTVTAVRGHASAVTSSGFATVSDVTGDAEARSEYGDVSVQGAGGDVVARTASGHATVVAGPDDAPVALTIRTASGRTTVEAPTDPSARRTVEIASEYGDVAYRLAR